MEDDKSKNTLKLPNTDAQGVNSADNSATMEDTPATAEKYDGMDGHLTESELRQDQRFVDNLANNMAEIDREVTAGAKIESKLNHKAAEQGTTDKSISLEEARDLLANETDRLKHELKVAEHKNRKTFVVVIIVALILCLAGVAFAVIMNNIHQEERNIENNTQRPSQSQPVEPSTPAEPEIKELALDDELVQKIYAPFKVFPGIQGYGYQAFFKRINGDDEDAKEGAKIVQILASTEPTKCRMSMINDATTGANVAYDDVGFCVDGASVAKKFKETYGYDITNRDIPRYGFCGGTKYFADYDQYFNGTACGGTGPSEFKKWLYKAETDGTHVYIYDLAEIWAAEFADENASEATRMVHCHTDVECSSIASDRKDGELMDIPSNVVLVGDNDNNNYGEGLEKVVFTDYAEQLDVNKWTFTKTADGNYIFSGLEQIK